MPWLPAPDITNGAPYAGTLTPAITPNGYFVPPAYVNYTNFRPAPYYYDMIMPPKTQGYAG